jgi:hypothetical protein
MADELTERVAAELQIRNLISPGRVGSGAWRDGTSPWAEHRGSSREETSDQEEPSGAVVTVAPGGSSKREAGGDAEYDWISKLVKSEATLT